MSATDEDVHDDLPSLDVPNEMEVIDVSEETMPKTDIQILVARVKVDNHFYAIPFKPVDDDRLELFTGPIVGDTNNHSGIQTAATITVEHLRSEYGYQIVLESTDEEPADTGPFDVYFCGGWEAVHIFENNDAESICGSVTVTAGRRSLDGIDDSISEIDGICPKCLRKLKMKGHFESYERPDGGSGL